VRVLDLPAPPDSASEEQPPWRVVAHSKKVVQGWLDLCQQIPNNAVRCYEWLQAHPMRRIPGRCYTLKHSRYAGCWAFEIGSGQRVYYKPKEDTREVLVFYAGPHPIKIPSPPKE